MSDTMIDTLPLLRELGETTHTQMLSRGELKRRGIDDDTINEAERLEEVVIASTDNTRNGQFSSLASVMLTDIGESKLDGAD